MLHSEAVSELTTPIAVTAPTISAEARRSRKSATDVPDRIFRIIASSSGTVVLAVMGLVGLFLAIRGSEALSVAGPSFITQDRKSVV